MTYFFYCIVRTVSFEPKYEGRLKIKLHYFCPFKSTEHCKYLINCLKIVGQFGPEYRKCSVCLVNINRSRVSKNGGSADGKIFRAV